METIELDGQYRALREEAGVTLRGRAFIAVSGPDGAEYLQGQLTNDVEALEPGTGAYAALLDRKGKMQTDMRVLRIAADEILIDLEPEPLGVALRHLTMYSVGRDVQVTDRTAEFALLAVAGPASAELAGLPPLGSENAHAEIAVDGISARAVRTDTGYELIAGSGSADALTEALRARGVVPVDEMALEILRVETGRPRYGREMTTETIPQEAGINERAVSFTKGCYIGQETVARLHYKGKPNRHLRGLRLTGSVDAGSPVRLGDKEIGRVGTAVLSPSQGPVALAILRREAQPGATVTVGDGTAATVCDLPF